MMGNMLSGMIAHHSNTLSSHSLHRPLYDVHVYSIICHTSIVKLITARGHHLAYTTLIKEIDSMGVRMSALALDAAHIIHILDCYWPK